MCKVCINNRVTDNVGNINETLEHLLMDVQSKMKDRPTPVRLSTNLALKAPKKQMDWKKWCSAIFNIKHLIKFVYMSRDAIINPIPCSTVCNIYKQILYTYVLHCHLSEPTCKVKKLIDHISTIIDKIKMLHFNVFLCSTINSYNAPYIIVNITTNKFEICHKSIRILERFYLESCINGWKTLPFKPNTYWRPFRHSREIDFNCTRPTHTIGKVKNELWVASYEFRYTNYEFNSMSDKFNSMSYKFKSTSKEFKPYELRVQIHELQVRIHELQIKIYKLRN